MNCYYVSKSIHRDHLNTKLNIVASVYLINFMCVCHFYLLEFFGTMEHKGINITIDNMYLI